MRKKQKKAQARPAPKRVLIKEVCPECGYSAVIRGTKCLMCVPCPRCGRKLMHCTCIEGE